MGEQALRVAGYARISYDEDNVSYESIINQSNIMKDYAKQHLGTDEVTIFEDDNFSGYKFNRPSFLRMKEAVAKGLYDVILSKDLSRLGRHNARTLLFIEEMQEMDIRVIAINDGIDTENSNNDITMGVKTWYNELYVKDISKKIKSTIINKQKHGNWICAVPYGYEMVDYKKQIFRVDEAAAEIVRRIYQLYIEGWGYKRIANYLTDQKIPTARMREKEIKEAKGENYKKEVKDVWSIVSISTILNNDFYIGTLRTGKYTRKGINGNDMKVDQSKHFIFEDNHEPIIERRIFENVQNLLKRRSTSNYRGIKKYDNVYSGMLFCGDCGAPMFSISNSKRPNAYTCGTYHRRGLKGCTSHHTHEETLNKLLKRYINHVRENSTDMIEELNNRIKEESNKINKKDDLISLLSREIEQLREEIKTMKRQRIREITKRPDDIDEIENIYEELEAESANKLRGLQNQLNHAVSTELQESKIKQIARDALEVFEEIINKPSFSKSDIELIIEKIFIYKDRISIKLKADVDALFKLNEPGISIDSQAQSIENFSIVQEGIKRKDKLYHTNVINEGDPLQTTLDNSDLLILSLSSFLQRHREATVS